MRFIKLCAILLVLSGCVKAPQPPLDQKEGALEGQYMVVNEGLFQQNNASISLVNPSTGEVQNNWFQTKYDRPLGDTGNEILQIGEKIFIIVNVSGTIEVINANSGDLIKQIKVQAAGVSRQPRSGLDVEGDLWVTCFDGTVAIIDTASLSIENNISVGRNPERLAQYENNVYVTNSGGLDAPNYDSTVSVIDVLAQQEVKKINVGINPSDVAADHFGNIYALSRGDYDEIASRLYIIDAENSSVSLWPKDSVSSVAAKDQRFFIQRTVDGLRRYEIYDALSRQKLKTQPLPWSQIQTPYGIYQTDAGDFLMKDAQSYTSNGKIYRVDKNGNINQTWSLGLIPTSVIKIK